MAKRKAHPKYAADQLEKMKADLADRIVAIFERTQSAVASFKGNPDFDEAVEIRDAAQLLVSTVRVHDDMDMYIRSAELSGEPTACISYDELMNDQ
jgi:hypothetical protein